MEHLTIQERKELFDLYNSSGLKVGYEANALEKGTLLDIHKAVKTRRSHLLYVLDKTKEEDHPLTKDVRQLDIIINFLDKCLKKREKKQAFKANFPS